MTKPKKKKNLKYGNIDNKRNAYTWVNNTSFILYIYI